MDFKVLNLLLKYGKKHCNRKTKTFGLTDTESMICSFIYSNEGCSQDDVAKAFNMDKTTTAKTLWGLEDKELVERSIAKDDRRKKSLKITEAGKEKCQLIFKQQEEWIDKLFVDFSEEEKKQMESFCSRLLAKADELMEEDK